ncbi:MAG: DUF2252 domain-containing protein [Acidobacteriia bacterium]|nr:DUF2252 domain-containing protein [Terriglobia bacterium]
MKISKATKKYEAWLAKRLTLLADDLALKHQRMAASAFPFFRATFYRWMQLWPELCPGLRNAPELLAVGDLHVENFGTWRDLEGRLNWGVNDFDEAYPLPYTLDLVRLATSALLAASENHFALPRKDACDALLDGYRSAITDGGAPIVLGEHHHWLRELTLGDPRDPVAYWKKLTALPTYQGKLPKSAGKALQSLFPEHDGLDYRIVHRVAGLGSLGRQRFVALADWRGAKIAREAKALAPSACAWARGGKASEKIHYEEILRRAVRSPDPFVHLRGRWIVRRLAPDCSRIELSQLPKKRDEYRLLREMGRETANVHLGTPKARKAVLRDLHKRPAKWLHKASDAMFDATLTDWEDWKSREEKS